MTAFYMWRLMGKTFYGDSHVDPHTEPNVHESAWQMTTPLILLAIPSIFLGMILGGGVFLGQTGVLAGWLEPVFEEGEKILARSPESFQLAGIDGALVLISVAVAAIGIAAGIYIFGWMRRNGRRDIAVRVPQMNGATQFLYRASLNKWWFDELNDLLFIRLGGRVAAGLWWFDRTIIDGAVNGLGTLTRDAGGGLRRIQTGRVQNYALGIAIGLLVMAGSFLVIVASPR
jgi:NADH-quinone oxidoreductase subunit L